MGRNILTMLLHKQSARQTIFKNTVWLSVGTRLNKLLSLALVIYAARILGAEGYGQFTFALAFASLLMIFSDLGLAAIITREFTHEEYKKEELYSLISFKLTLLFGTLLLIVLSSFIVVREPSVRMVVWALASFFLINSFLGVFHSFFHALQKMEYEAWFEILQTVCIVVFGLFVLFRFPSPQALSYAYLLAALIALFGVLTFFQLRVFPLRIRWDILVWKRFLKMSWPLALISLFGVVYGYIDSVMLGSLNMMAETGWYNAAYKIVMASLVPMGFIGASFYPALSKFSRESKEKLQKAWDYEVEIMIALALPLVVGGILLASKIIYAFYPLEFTPSILAFQILIVTAGLTFLYRPLYDAMIVLNQQQKTFWITMAGAAVNVGLNLLLIPKYSLYGAAVATVGTHFLTLFCILFFIKKFTSLRFATGRICFTVSAAAAASAIMVVLLQNPLLSLLPIFLLVPIAAGGYFSAFFLLRKYVGLRYFSFAYA